MVRVTYVPSLLNASRLLCALILRAKPVIQRLYPENENLMLALEAASVACDVLNSELLDVREFGT